MSLNGLDAADVKDAYDSAIVEAGGWSVPYRQLECHYMHTSLTFDPGYFSTTSPETQSHCWVEAKVVSMRLELPLPGIQKSRRSTA